MQRILHVQELVPFILVDRGQRDARPLRHDLVDLGPADDHPAGIRLDVELLAHELEVLAGLHFLLAIELCLLEILFGDGRFHLFDGDANAAIDLAELFAVSRLAQLRARAGFVDQIDRLVGKEPVGNVSIRLIHGRFDGFGRVLDVVEGLVAILDARQHLDRFAFGRRIDLDRLEAPLERPILLDVFPVLGRRRRANAADFAARQRRLQDIGGIERTFGRTGTDQRVKLVDEHDDVRVLGELLHDRFQPFLELTAILGAGDDERNVEGEQPLVGEEMRNIAVDNLLREPFDDGRLADTRFADEDRVVLRAAAEHLLNTLDLDVTPHERVELILHRRFGEVAAELGEQRRFLHARQRGLLVEERHDVLAHGVEAHPLFHEDRRRDGPLFAKDAEQQMLGPDVVVQKPIGLFRGELEDALGLRAEGNLDRGRDLFAEHGAALDFFADAFEGEVGAGKNPAREPFALADQSEEKVLGLNRNASELARLVAGEEEHAPRSFRVTFEHPVTYVTEDYLFALYGNVPVSTTGISF